MDSCVLAETGVSNQLFLIGAFILIGLGAGLYFCLQKKPASNIFKLLTVIAMVCSVSIFSTTTLHAQSQENCNQTTTAPTPTPSDSEDAVLELVNDSEEVQFAGFEDDDFASFFINILDNDLPPSDDPIDWSTVDLDPDADGIQVTRNVYHPDFPTYWCGNFIVDPNTEQFSLYVEETCYNEDGPEDTPFPDLPVQFSTPYSALTLSGVPAVVAATVTIDLLQPNIVAEDIFYNGSACNNIDFGWSEDIMANVTGNNGVIPLASTIDLDPSTPGRQTQFEAFVFSNSIVFTVDGSGIVTGTSSGVATDTEYSLEYTIGDGGENVSAPATLTYRTGGCG